MKNILKISVLSLMFTFMLSSCSDFLDTAPYTAVGESVALTSADDIQVATTGLYNSMRNSYYYGRHLPVIGDIAGDITTKKFNVPGNNWYEAIERFAITDGQTELSEMWIQMYRVVDRATRIIVAGERLKSSGTATEQSLIHACLGQAYAIKALSLFNLVNIFGLPYGSDATAAANLGVVNVGNTPIKVGDAVVRATVAENYTQILNDITAAKNAWSNGKALSSPWYHMNAAAVNALEARVKLYKKDYAGAKAAANAAITARGSSLVTSGATYLAMWAATSASAEDIFTLTTNASEQLGTTSIAYFYGNPGYEGRLTPKTVDLFAQGDMRRVILDTVNNANSPAKNSRRPLKYPSVNNISNTPVFRLPEMYLIIAECEALDGTIANAQTALFNTAKRNPAITAATDLPSDQAGLVNFIKEERIRELFAEGHRLFDIRRTGELLTKDLDNNVIAFSNYDVAKFAFPIPLGEINASKLVQNDWSNNLPK